MRLNNLSSVFALFFCFALCAPLVGFADVAQGKSKSINYGKSPLSDDHYFVRTVLASGRVVGCVAVNRISKPTIFMTLLSEGAGSISLSQQAFGVSGFDDSVTFSLAIGNQTRTVKAPLDGDIFTFGLLDNDIADAERGGIAVNGKVLDKSEFKKIRELAATCISLPQP